MQKLANEINMSLKIVHYPPYTSKWNPIEHKVFPHITRAMSGIPLNSIETAEAAIASAKTKTGLTVVTDILKKTYAKGKEVAKDYLDHLKITHGDSLPKLNYTISSMIGT